MVNHFRIKTRAAPILFFVALGVIVAGVSALYSWRSQIVEERKSLLRDVLDVTLSIARAEMQAAGGSNSEAGKHAFYKALRSNRFAESNYVFAYDYSGTTLNTGDHQKIGRNQIDMLDGNGNKLIQKLIAVAKGPKGEGYWEYSMPKGTNGPVATKISFVRHIPELNCFAGVGIYLDDVHASLVSRFLMQWGLLALLVISLCSSLLGLFVFTLFPVMSSKIDQVMRILRSRAAAVRQTKVRLGKLECLLRHVMGHRPQPRTRVERVRSAP